MHSTPTVAGQSSRADWCHGSQRRTPKPIAGDSIRHVVTQREYRQLGGAPSETSQDRTPALQPYPVALSTVDRLDDGTTTGDQRLSSARREWSPKADPVADIEACRRCVR